MSKTANITKLVVILMAIVVTTGCNTMNITADSMKYGKLYTMQDALSDAVQNCEDRTIRNRALNWAMIGYSDLDSSRQFMEKRSQQYAETRSLMRSLATISSRRINSIEKLCSDIEIVASVSRDYLANINNMSRYASDKGAVVLAISSY